MKSLLRPVSIPFLASLPKPNSTRHSCARSSHQISATAAAAPHTTHDIFASICDSLRKGSNWDTLTRICHVIELDATLVEQVLLQFKDPADARRSLCFFHWASHSKKSQHGIRAYCIAIHISSRAGLLNDAHALLESVLRKNGGCRVADSIVATYKVTDSSPLVFNLLVQCCSKLRMIQDAFDVCCYLDEQGFCLSLITFNTLLHAIHKSSEKMRHMIWEVYGHMIEKRVYPNEVTVRIMINALCKEGELQNVVDVLDRIQGKRCSPTVIVNTSLLIRMLGEGRVHEVLVSMKRMLQKGMILDTVCFSLIVFARVKQGELEAAWKVYEEMLKRGFSPNAFVHTSFIGAHCENRMVDKACSLMQEMVNELGLKPYGETYNHLVAGCAITGKLDDGIRFCEEMIKKGLAPGCSSFNLMLGRLCECGSVKQADDLLTLAMENGFVPDEITYSHLIQGYGKEGNLQEVLKLFYELEYRSHSPGLLIFVALIKALCQHKKPEEADRYLAKMKARSLEANESLYKALIAGHLAKGNTERAHALLSEMLEKEPRPKRNEGTHQVHTSSRHSDRLRCHDGMLLP